MAKALENPPPDGSTEKLQVMNVPTNTAMAKLRSKRMKRAKLRRAALKIINQPIGTMIRHTRTLSRTTEALGTHQATTSGSIKMILNGKLPQIVCYEFFCD